MIETAAQKEFPKGITFKYNWRSYQQRVLDELGSHLSDRHLHIIAPPGSGKTVLGLEVALRLNKPCLILAPTIAIRNQWIQRFCELFLDSTQVPEWISNDIRNPKFLTVATYQGLHAACQTAKGKEKEEDSDEYRVVKASYANITHIVSGLKKQQVKVIIVDEAHHLKNEWWQTLSRIKSALDPKIVGLTATPPYDVTAAEWHRYITLNGSVDTEISVPELVDESDLCPHQDYVHMTYPSNEEADAITRFRQHISQLFAELNNDLTLIKAIEEHPIWTNPHENLEWVYQNLPCYSACLIFLHANGRDIPETHLEVIGEENLEIPNLDYKWMEALLDFYLFTAKDDFHEYEEHQTQLENRLKRYGALDRRKVRFTDNTRLRNSLGSSISKLDGIQQIVDFEYAKLGNKLRLVVLGDFIRPEYFPNKTENLPTLKKIGIIPIFEKLRRNNHNNKKLGVLTGSIVIIPHTAVQAFIHKAQQYGVDVVRSSPLSFDPAYVQINQTENLKHDIVHIITQLFQEGGIEVLIGTKSLLGEGWDAPGINSLILASFVGSFVLSNQMRGRAIRTQRNNPEKTSHIWHLACVDPTMKDGGEDMKLIRRRFRAFVGVSLTENPGIENGIGRLQLPQHFENKQEIETNNARMFSFATKREDLKDRWQKALKNGVELVEEIRIPFLREKPYEETKKLYLNRSIAYLTTTLGLALTAYLETTFSILGRTSRLIRSSQELNYLIMGIGLLGLLFFGRRAFKALKLYFSYRDIAKDIHQIGNSLLKTLIKSGLIQTESSKLKVLSFGDDHGAVYCHLEGGTTFEKSLFINALEEIIGVVSNPRYIIVRKSKFLALLEHRDFHAVPDLIGRNKHLAEYFAKKWGDHVGNCELVYARTLSGRKLLLKARIKALSSQFEQQTEHINKWR